MKVSLLLWLKLIYGPFAAYTGCFAGLVRVEDAKVLFVLKDVEALLGSFQLALSTYDLSKYELSTLSG